jgi:anti-sigma factor RsiW
MAIEHFTDEQIQDYLDGNLPHDQVSILTGHLQSCQKCQSEMAQYQSLYVELKEDVAFNLSPTFSNAVMKAVQAGAKKALLARLWNLLLPVIGIAVGIGVMIYYVDFKPFLKVFTDSLNPGRYFDSAVLSELNQVLTKLNVNLNIIVFAGLSLLAVILIDHLISRHKEKLFSYLRILPILS